MDILLPIICAFGGALVGAMTTEMLERRRDRAERARKEARAISSELESTREAIGLLRVTLRGLTQRQDDLVNLLSLDERNHHET